MDLKKATKLVYLALIAELALSIFQWALYSFDLVSYGSFGRGFQIFLSLVQIVLSVPMILFFAALNAKQKSVPDQRPE